MKNRITDGWIYLAHCGDFYKIGCTRSLESVEKQLNVTGYDVDIMASIFVENACEIEKKLHRIFEEYRVKGKWYDFGNSAIAEPDFSDAVLAVKNHFSL